MKPAQAMHKKMVRGAQIWWLTGLNVGGDDAEIIAATQYGEPDPVGRQKLFIAPRNPSFGSSPHIGGGPQLA
jgi:hypothetical protein